MDKYMLLKFNKVYAMLFLVVLIFEISISKTSGFLRHTVGDFFAVIMLFYLIKTFFDISPIRLGIYVLLFAFSLEFCQLLNGLEKIGLAESPTAILILGNTFSFFDLLAYFMGILTVVFLENTFQEVIAKT